MSELQKVLRNRLGQIGLSNWPWNQGSLSVPVLHVAPKGLQKSPSTFFLGGVNPNQPQQSGAKPHCWLSYHCGGTLKTCSNFYDFKMKMESQKSEYPAKGEASWRYPSYPPPSHPSTRLTQVDAKWPWRLSSLGHYKGWQRAGQVFRKWFMWWLLWPQKTPRCASM